MTEVHTEHIEFVAGEGFRHTEFTTLANADRNPEYSDVQVVPSERDEHCYLVAKIQTLTKPKHKADAIEDTVTLPMCSCDDYYYRCFKPIRTRLNIDEDFSKLTKCKHIQAVYPDHNS